MARRIISLPNDLGVLNTQLKQTDLHKAQIAELQAQVGLLFRHVQQIRDTRQIGSVNNLLFTWTGGGSTLSWANGYVQDSSLKNYPVPAGSIPLDPSTYYWLAWSPPQQRMVAQTDLQTLFAPTSNPNTNSPLGNNIIICNVYTGTGGQTGTAGGGGSAAGGTAPTGREYKLF